MPSPAGRIVLKPASLLGVGTRRGSKPSYAGVTVGETTARRMPSLGLNGFGPVTPEVADLVRSLSPGHIGIDATLESPDLGIVDNDWLAFAGRSRVPMEIRLDVPTDAALSRRHLIDRLHLIDRPGRIKRILLVGALESLASEAAADVVRALHASSPGLEIAVGTRGPFAVVNRSWQDVAAFEAVCFGLNPQTHASDDLTIMENLESIPAILQTARRVGGKRRIHVSPITLTPPPVPAVNAVALAPNSSAPREATPFGAAWTLGSVAALAWSGATSATFHSIGGSNGVMRAGNQDAASRVGGVSMTGTATGDLFASLGMLRSGRLIRLGAGHEHPLAGLGLEVNGRRHLLIANLVDVPCRLTIAGIGPATVTVWPDIVDGVRRGPLVVELGAYGWARISEA
ncbi:MAG: hypothetical protein ACXWW1_02845 [Aeromicrobium sp.]